MRSEDKRPRTPGPGSKSESDGSHDLSSKDFPTKTLGINAHIMNAAFLLLIPTLSAFASLYGSRSSPFSLPRAHTSSVTSLPLWVSLWECTFSSILLPRVWEGKIVPHSWDRSGVLKVVLEREPGSGSIHFSAYGCIAPGVCTTATPPSPLSFYGLDHKPSALLGRWRGQFLAGGLRHNRSPSRERTRGGAPREGEGGRAPSTRLPHLRPENPHLGVR